MHSFFASDGTGGRFSTEYGDDLSGLSRLGGRRLLEVGSTRLGLDAEFNGYLDDTAVGVDELWTKDVNSHLSLRAA